MNPGVKFGIKIPKGWIEPRMAAERNKLHMPTLGTGIHSTAIRGVTTVNHPVNVFNFCGAWMKSAHVIMLDRRIS